MPGMPVACALLTCAGVGNELSVTRHRTDVTFKDAAEVPFNGEHAVPRSMED